MKTSEIGDILSVSTLSKKGDIYTGRWGYFWGITQSGEVKAELVKKFFPTAEIITFGNHFTPFRGGAPVARQSHYYVKFRLL